MAALFLDENLPDGTRLQPGAAFVKYWKMRNSGSVGWTAETKLVFMWGNLGLASEERREVAVPPLRPGQVGVVSVALAAPRAEGSYTSHWRLAHRGRQFGPRVWCSVVVDPAAGRRRPGPAGEPRKEEEEFRTEDGDPGLLADFQHGDLFFPSDELLTPQDLLSFQLLDVNIVQELDKVPNNTPADLTPCMSPLPPDAAAAAPVRGGGPRAKPDGEASGVRTLFGLKPRAPREAMEPPAPDDEREDEISGAQFLCETVIRSLALDQEPDHRPVRRAPRVERVEASPSRPALQPGSEVSQQLEDTSHDAPGEPAARPDDWDEVSSQSSSSSSSEDYIIVLPDCFDTTRPLGESMYSSAMSQPDAAAAARPSEEERRESGSQEEALREEPVPHVPPVSPVPPVHGSVSHMLCASQTLDAVTLTPEVVPPPALPRPLLPPPALPRPLLPPPALPRPLLPPPALYSPRSEALYLAEDPGPPACDPDQPQEPRVHLNLSGLSRSAGSCSSAFETYTPRPGAALQASRGQGGLTEGLVKGALSVAASAYKALFTGPGPGCSVQRGVDPAARRDPAARQDPALMAVLLEMGFRDQRLNQQLLRKHGHSLLHTVNELVQRAEDRDRDQNRGRDHKSQSRTQNPALDALH